MRAWWIVIASLVIGNAAGFGLTYFESVRVEDRFEASYGQGTASEVDWPKAVVVGGPSFDFGTLDRHKSGEHTFVIENQGNAPLQIDNQQASCPLCISSEFTTKTIMPGETCEILVTYKTNKPVPNFEEHLEIATTDPELDRIRLMITGYVVHDVRFSVENDELALGSFIADEGTSADLFLYGYTGDRFVIKSFEFTNSRTAEFFDATFTPVEAAEFQKVEERAKAATRITVKTLTGLPIGPLTQTLRLDVELADDKTKSIELKLSGTVASDISLLGGTNFLRESNVLKFGTVPQGAGATAVVRVHVKGPHAAGTELSIASIDPEGVLKAEIGERKELASGGYLYPVTVTIDKDAPPIIRLGSTQAKVGVVKIATTHPTAKEVPLYVSFAVQ